MKFALDYWDGGDVEVMFVAGEPPHDMPITGVGCYTFTQPGQLVLTQNRRGWDYPGGHVESGETPLETLHREIDEEIAGQIVGEPVLVGHRIARKLRQTPQNAQYPNVAATLHYAAFVQLTPDFQPRLEITDRCFVAHDTIADTHHNWTAQCQQVLDYTRQLQPHFFHGE